MTGQTPEEVAALLQREHQLEQQIRTENAAERTKDRDEAAQNRRSTFTLGILSGAIGLLAGLGTQGIEAFRDKKAGIAAYALESSSGQFTFGTRSGLFRFDSKNGMTWYARERKDSVMTWVLIQEPSGATLPSVAAGPKGRD